MPEYTLHLGGGIDARGAVFGRQVVKLPARRVPEGLVALLRLYQAKKQPGERALDFFRRLTDAEVKETVAALTNLDDSSRAEDFLDNGSDDTFMVKTRDGECAA